MKCFAVLAALIAVGLATEEAAKPLTYTLPYAAGLPLTYGNYAGLYHPYAYGAHAPLTYTTAAAPVTYAAAAPITTVAAAAPVAKIEAAPVATVAAPVTYAAAYAPYTQGSQFHAQDEFGNLQYGYSNINSVKQETGNAYGGVAGGYSYVDANNQLQTVNYVADGLGFRVADSRLPVAPTFNPEPLVAPVYDGVAPEAVVDTPEVAEARAAHLAAVEAAKAERKRRSADPAVLAAATRVLTAPTPLIHNAPVVAATYGYNYPLNYGYTGLPYYGRYLL